MIKMGVAASFVGVSAVCLGTWSENKLLFPGNLVTVSVALQMVAAVRQFHPCKQSQTTHYSRRTQISSLLLSHFEHFRTLRPSILLPFYFLSTLLCDAARLRSFAVTGFLDGAGSFFWAFSASFVLRFCFFVTENVEKGRIFREQHSGKVRSSSFTNSRWPLNISVYCRFCHRKSRLRLHLGFFLRVSCFTFFGLVTIFC